MNSDQSEVLQGQVAAAIAGRTPLVIQGGGSKAFYGHPSSGELLDLSGHRGIFNYEPTELVLTARAGTPLAEIEQTLAAEGQMLPFEPPHFGPGATLGGTIACNLAGPRRPYGGAARDLVLGSRILNGKGEQLHFGGEVMKNVAGYDVSRLMAGAMGTLGVLLEVSLKVLPRPAEELTLVREMQAAQALDLLQHLGRESLPLSATCHHAGQLYLRLCGSADAVDEARAVVGGEPLDNAASFWHKLREQQLDFFTAPGPLWRLSLAAAAPAAGLPGAWLYEWGGALRWYKGPASAAEVRALAEAHGGHATLFRGELETSVFHPLPEPMLRLHRQLKQALDPHGLFNPGRLYPEL